MTQFYRGLGANQAAPQKIYAGKQGRIENEFDSRIWPLESNSDRTQQMSEGTG